MSKHGMTTRSKTIMENLYTSDPPKRKKEKPTYSRR